MSNDRWMPKTGNNRGIPDNEENALDLFSGMGANEKSQEPAKPQSDDASKSIRLQQPSNVETPVSRAPQTPNEAPVSRAPMPAPAPAPAQKPNAPQTRWEPTPMDEAGQEDDLYKKDFRKLVRNLIFIGIGVLAAVCLIILAVFQKVRYGNKNKGSSNASSSISQISQEEKEYKGAEVFGVIESVDTQKGDVTIYNAETGTTKVFNLNRAGNITDQYGNEIAISSLHRGQVVNVQFNATDESVTLFRITARVTKLSNASGAVISGDKMSVAGATYSMDDHLICMYQGEEYAVTELGPEQVFTAMILDGHIYTIYITYSTGNLQLENYSAYIGGSLVLTSEYGTKSEPVDITDGMGPVEVPEGLNTVSITLNNATAYSGSIFIVGGETRILRLPDSATRAGSVKLVAFPETTTIIIDGQYYANGETIELEYGQHSMSASASGYSNVDKTLTVSQPYQRVLIYLTNSTTEVSISSALANSAVYVDGVYQGTAPLRVSLEPGTYTIALVTPGYYDASMTVTVNSGDLEKVLYFSDFVPLPEESSEEPSSEEPSSEEPDWSEEPSSEEPSSEEPEWSEETSSEEPSSEEPWSEEPSSEEPSWSEEPSSDEGGGQEEPSWSEEPGGEDAGSTEEYYE